MSHDWDDEPVGYKKPPRWTQFAPGKSGNPKGRPRKKALDRSVPQGDSAADNILRAELAREIMVTDAKGSRSVSMLEVVTRSQINAAATGNVHAQREVRRSALALEERDAARDRAREAQKRESFERIVQYKKNLATLWGRAIAEGREAPDGFLPHPDDILIDADKMTWHVRGPADESDLPLFEYFEAMRDAHALKWSIMNREKHPLADLYLGLAMWFDAHLPRKWQKLLEEPASDRTMLSLAMMRLPRLRTQLKAAEEKADRLRRIAKVPPAGRDGYKTANAIMKPLLKPLGYCSLAQFERTCETRGISD
jgi:hypothetical protein